MRLRFPQPDKLPLKGIELHIESRISCCASRTFACRVALNDRTHKGQEDQVDLVLHDKSLALGLELTQASLGLFERFGCAVSLGSDPRQLLAPVAILIGSLRGFVVPLRSALSDFGHLAHHALSGQDRPPQATGDPSVRCR